MICKERNPYEKTETNVFLRLIRSLCFTMVISILFIFAISMIVTYTNISDSIVSSSVNILRLISILLCSVIFTFGQKTRGWLKGLISGGLFCVVLYLAGFVFIDEYSHLSNPIRLFTEGILLGMTGGIIGINLKSPHKTK